jgi:hypothetical protein
MGGGSGNPVRVSAPLGVTVSPSRLEGVKLVDDGGGISIIFGGGQDAEFAVAGLEDGDADHEGGGEVPATGVSGAVGLRRVPAAVLEAGTPEQTFVARSQTGQLGVGGVL